MAEQEEVERNLSEALVGGRGALGRTASVTGAWVVVAHSSPARGR